MKKAKKILSLLLVIALTATITLSATLAYLTDEEEAVNVMVMGNIDIEQREHDRNGEDFEQGQTLLPIVGNTTQKDANGYPLPDNYIDKIVSVKNVGGNDAYVRTFIAIPNYTYDGQTDNDASANVLHWNGYSEGDAAPSYPTATWLPAEKMGVDNHWSWGKDAAAPVWPGNGGDWNTFETTIDGQAYTVYVVTHTTKVAPNEITAPNMTGVYLDSMVDYDHESGKYTINGNVIEGFDGTVEVLVATQAVQYDKGWADAWDALNTAFGVPTADANHPWTDNYKLPAVVETAADLNTALEEGRDAILNEDIDDAPVDTKAPYGNYYGIALNGGVLDGAGNTLDFNEGELHNGKLDNYGIMTSGGTIKNVTITGVFRGIVIMNPTEDVYIDNVTVGDEDVCYAINTAEGDGTHSLYVSNSTIKGWSSYGTAIKDLTFTNCTFAQGEYYTDVFGRLVKPYVDTLFDGCEFNSKFYIDLSAFEGTQIVLRNCTVNGVKLTADNWTSLIVSEGDCGEGQISIEAKDGSYMSASNILDYVVIE